MSHENTKSEGTAPLVSVIIPTYNRKELLQEAVASCLAQTYGNIEVLVVDDGSTDGTDEFVAQQSTGPRVGRNIKYHRQANAGAPAARNRGLALATGDYVQFLDSDDILFKEKIALQVTVLEHPDNAQAEGCTCYGRIGTSVEDSAANRRIGVHCQTPEEYLQRLSSRIVHGMPTLASLWRRSFLASRSGWRTDIDLGDDLEYHIRLLAQAKEIKFVEQELFFVREHPGLRLSDAFKNRARTLSAIRARMAIFETLRTSGHWDAQTQENFLGAMRTIYANLLNCGTAEDIQRLETWVLECSRSPARRLFFPLVIALRRTVGKHAILAAHRLVIET
jgi:glycosyltransferase involved in cell wall biosynthesis